MEMMKLDELELLARPSSFEDWLIKDDGYRVKVLVRKMIIIIRLVQEYDQNMNHWSQIQDALRGLEEF